MSGLRHAIVGVGGVGGTIGACLARSGVAVTLVVRPESLAAYPERVDFESPFGNFEVPVAHADQVPPCDVLWITVKATQLDSALHSVVNPDAIAAMVPLLNGIDHLALLRGKYGRQRVIAATIAGEMERVAPGHFVHRTPFLRLDVSSAGRELLGSTLDGFQKIGFECRFLDDEPTLMWSKIVFLAPFALTTSAADRTTGEISSDPVWRARIEACVREACAVAQAEGARVNAEAVIAGMMKMPGNMRSSMQKDVERGNPPELDAIAGAILRAGARHGIRVPTTEQLAAEVERRSAEVQLAKAVGQEDIRLHPVAPSRP
jgi:2-dehydropantoate 2-reductase